MWKDYEPGKWLTKGKVYTTDAENMLTFDVGFATCAGHGIAGFTEFIKRNPNWKNHLVPLVSRPAKVGEWVGTTLRLMGDCGGHSARDKVT